MAGSETLATTLSVATYYLATHPGIFAKAQKEVRNTFASGEEIGLDSRKPISYLHAIIKETLQIFPPMPLSSARIIGKTGEIIAGTHIPPRCKYQRLSCFLPFGDCIAVDLTAARVYRSSRRSWKAPSG